MNRDTYDREAGINAARYYLTCNRFDKSDRFGCATGFGFVAIIIWLFLA